MPKYGFEKGAMASSKSSKKNEKTLPMRTTEPIKLSQFRNTELRRGVSADEVGEVMVG
jgi:hypothetical protein